MLLTGGFPHQSADWFAMAVAAVNQQVKEMIDMPFTQEELAEMAAADAEIERSFRITSEERRRSRELDADGRCDALIGTDRYRSAAAQKEYREANREKIAAAKKEYYEANREKIAAAKKEYREANREKINAYMREYRAARRQRSAK